MMSKKNWTILETSNLIEHYKMERNLWDPKSREYQNKMIKQMSYMRLADVFGVSTPEIDRKIKNLLSQHRRERRKHRQHKKSGEAGEFISKWFGYHLMGFLNDKYRQRRAQVKEELQVSESSLSADENGYEFTQESVNDSHQWDNELQIKEELFEEDQNAYLCVQELKEQVTPKQIKKIKPENEHTTEMMDILKSIDEQKKSNNYVDESTTTGIVNLMKNFFNEQRNFNKNKDEFDIFGELIARKIRNLNTHYARATVQNMLNNILYEAELGKYDGPSTTHQNDILDRGMAISGYVNGPSTSTYSSVDTTYLDTKSVAVQQTDCLKNNLD